jgi:UDP-hydrolysing UDP-N-acetyl-D-glucosamine 2-epimerase
MTRKVLALTTSRSDYGLLRPVLRAINDHADLMLLLLVSGTHLSAQHGRTITEIEADGLPIAVQMDLGLSETESDARDAVAALASITAQTGQALHHVRPDVLLVLGDRYEVLGACAAALMVGIPVAHIHGGELTLGAIDDAIRHAITKIASLHFPVHEVYARRIKQLGEEPRRIKLIDPPVAETLSEFRPETRAELSAYLEIEFEKHVVSLTFHPSTINIRQSLVELSETLSALEKMSDLTVVVSGMNADPGAAEHQTMLQSFVQKDPARRIFVESLGHDRYLSLLHCCDCVIGNSSSGLIEAPLLGTPSINIGHRQDGRITAPSVETVKGVSEDILSALHRVLAIRRGSPSRRPAIRVGKHVADTLASFDFSTPKRFIDEHD